MVARKELQPLALRIIPRASGLRLAATDENEDITVDFAGARETVKYMRIPAENSYARDSGSTLIIDPLEFISESSDFAMEYEGGCVELKRVMSGVAVSSFPRVHHHRRQPSPYQEIQHSVGLQDYLLDE